MKKLLIAPALAAVLTSLVGVDVVARPNVPNPNGGPTSSSFGKFQSAVCIQGTSKAELDINNVRAMVLNGGDMWWDLDNARYEVPKVEDPNGIKKHSIFAGAVWIGGVDAATNQLHLAAQTFRQGGDQGYWPGPLDANAQIVDATCGLFDFHAKIDAQVVADFMEFAASAPKPIAEESIPLPIRNWPGKGNPFRSNISSLGVTLAPFEDLNNDGVYDPREGEYPKIKGDQSIWWVMNDVAGIKTPTSPVIGLELQVQAFAFKASDLRNNMTFYEQTMINRGSKVLRNTYLAQWVDPDLGNYLDDYVGCDVGRGLGYVFNGDEVDEGVSGYGATPPALGVDFFAGPRSDANDGLDNDRDGIIDELETVIDCETGDESTMTEEIIMSNFVYYNNNSSGVNGNPQADTDFYNYMQSKWRNGNDIYFGGDGITLITGVPNERYKFMFPGSTDPLGYGYHQPVPGVNPGDDYVPPYTFAGGAHVPFVWSEDNPGPGQEANAPADRRFLQSAGPFTLSPGQVLPLTIGVVWARATSGGRNGSLRLLTVADDAAQSLFNNCFILPKGPNAPDMAITELDQELIISLIPDVYTLNGRTINTEQYAELDRTLQSIPDTSGTIDPFYRFQGYIVYQLKNANVTQAELGNPDLARVVEAENGSGQSDVRDDLTLLVNREFNVDLGDYVSVPKVIGENQGIRHTLRVKRDMFAQGESRLSNFKAYHYMVIAYASNTLNDVDKLNTFNQYRPGIDNIRVYTAYPHKVAPESGMQLNSFSGQGLDVTRLFGIGNGGNVLEIDSVDELAIVNNNYKAELKYQGGNAPVAINVYDPKRVAKADFNLKFSSRLSLYADETSGITFDDNDQLVGLSVGDTIVSGPLPVRNPTAAFPTKLSSFPQIEGRAIINRIISTDAPIDNPRRVIVLDLQMLNDQFGGTFEVQIDSLKQNFNPDEPNAVNPPFVIGYPTIPLSFRKTDGSVSGPTIDFGLNDLWKMTITPENEQPRVVYSERPISDFNEQLLPEYGLSLQLIGTLNPGNQVEVMRTGGIQEGGSSITYSGPEWLAPVAADTVFWFTDDTNLASQLDPARAYSTFLNRTWAPYELATQYILGGPRYHFPPTNARIDDLPNVNVVMTNDRSKWTKVVVLQAEIYSRCKGLDSTGTNVPISSQRLLKSTVPSVDMQGNPTGALSPYPGTTGNPAPSTGIGWFPGYAVDIDRGVRLNMMFSESRFRPDGNNLMWDPTTEANGGRSGIYLMNSVYDEGRATERLFDSLMTLPNYVSTAGPTSPQFNCINRDPNRFMAAVGNTIFSNVTWVGYMRVAPGATKLASDARVKLRVNKEYRSYATPDINIAAVNENPEYAFNTYGTAVSTGNIPIATSALDLIRVVPNPYYAYSDYEQRVTDNTVKITNLPPRATISIFNLNGTLIQTLQKSDPTLTFIEWNLKNRENLAIASGVYIIHVKAELRDKDGNITEEEKVVKFFAILRPIDLQSF